MARRSGLGKGLSSLIPPGETEPGEPPARSAYCQEVPVADITPNPHQPRVHFDEESLAELTASIQQIGVLQPILVRPSRVRVRADRRRATLARRRPCRAGDDSGRGPDDRRPGFGRAGAGREPASPGPHAARGGGRLSATDRRLRADPRTGGRPGRQEPVGDHQHAAAARTSADDPAAAGRWTAVGRSRTGAARRRPTAPCRRSSLQLAAEEGWTVRGVEEAVRRGGGPVEPVPPAPVEAPRPSHDGAGITPTTRLRPPGLLELEQLLADHLETRVNVQMGAKRGRIAIDFADLEDLERIYRRMTGE